jgi:hypothetical protein
MRGSGVLLIERGDASDVFVYLPEVKRVRRITGRHVSGSLFGTDFTYEHLERLQGMAGEASAARKPDATLDGRVVYVIDSAPAARPAAPETAAAPADPVVTAAGEVERVVTYVDRDTCVPLKTEMYTRGGKLRWVMTSDPASVTKEGAGFLPRRVKLEDKERGTWSELLVEKIESSKPLPERHFTETALVQEGS